MTYRLSLFLTLLLCGLLALSGCTKTATEPAAEASEPPEMDISTVLSAQQVYEATGFAVGETVRFSEGEVCYYSKDHLSSASIIRQQMTVEDFDQMVQSYADGGVTLTDAPGLGEKASWCENTVELLVYARGYALDVQVEYSTPRPNDSLLAARQLAALLLEAW